MLLGELILCHFTAGAVLLHLYLHLCILSSTTVQLWFSEGATESHLIHNEGKKKVYISFLCHLFPKTTSSFPALANEVSELLLEPSHFIPKLTAV